MTGPPVLRCIGLGRRYGRRWALQDCDLEVPAGRVTGLVGPNGSGKSTLLGLATGMVRPTAGTIEVCGGDPAVDAHQLARVGYVAQDSPLYAQLSVEDHLQLGRRLNERWDDAGARVRVAALGLDPRQRAGTLSGGQRAQLALTLGLAKRPELLVLDEPAASLDPLARRDLLRALMEAVADQGLSVILSSHVVSDLERVCDHLVVLVGGRVRLAGDVDDLVEGHRRLVGPPHDPALLPGNQQVVRALHTERQSTLVVRTTAPVLDPTWTVSRLGVEDLVLSYLEAAADAPAESRLEAVQ